MQTIIYIEEKSSTPKYKQIIEGINSSILRGDLKKGDRIPSLNDLCSQYHLSQDTVLTAYKQLKMLGIITSSVGKGYFVSNTKVEANHRIFILFDKLTAYKEALYESMKVTVKGRGVERLYFHSNDPWIFKTIIETVAGKYTEYIIMPINDTNALKSLEILPQKKIFILDQGRAHFKNRYPGVCQNFEYDLYNILKKNYNRIKKFQKLLLVIKHQRAHFKEIIMGFKKYYREFEFDFEIVYDMSNHIPRKNEVYIVVDDGDLVILIKSILEAKLKLGNEVGIISYNESPLKEVISGGISTISTDFKLMGKSIVEMALTGKKDFIDNPFIMVQRNSF